MDKAAIFLRPNTVLTITFATTYIKILILNPSFEFHRKTGIDLEKKKKKTYFVAINAL